MALHDNYVTYSTPPSQVPGKKIPLNIISNFSNMQSIELPISVAYTVGRFNILFGGNIVYDFAINPNELSYPHPTVYSGAEPGNVSSGQPKVQLSDFSSKFGLGYLFGVSYQATSDISVDMRMVQTAWNDSKTPGGAILFRDLYNSPSLQFSIRYRLVKDKKATR